jgi:hypothetical protein
MAEKKCTVNKEPNKQARSILCHNAQSFQIVLVELRHFHNVANETEKERKKKHFPFRREDDVDDEGTAFWYSRRSTVPRGTLLEQMIL